MASSDKFDHRRMPLRAKPTTRPETLRRSCIILYRLFHDGRQHSASHEQGGGDAFGLISQEVRADNKSEKQLVNCALWCLRDCFTLVILFTVLFSGRVEISDSTTLHFNMNAVITSGHNTATRVAMDYGQQKGQHRIRM
jgi:hypothetical protein